MSSKTKPIIYWSLMEHDGWTLYIAATANGLCFVGSQNQPFEELSTWAEKRFSSSALVRDDEILQPYISEITEYLYGNRQEFTLPLDYHGTPFQISVWNALCEIPFGETKTYSEIANRIHKSSAVRAVGTAIGANPVLITVPCHRVIGKNGSLTGYRGGLEMKTKLLKLEKEGGKPNA
ncbi:methylated-DNA--[protein]-cysteine S-methyltransferase [Bacillus sp. MUM 116]|uniref:methylated-DNA--[protein]-cysteine S-methyltransferase n=1 Tax=Bacillus sp. MUM 116 TaxID=1678002 RepID=UPI002108A995|nr:methylated-DNA--[protein]-cysteine S-methyltransferase [Bacillus sp. MUM 116]